MASGFELELDSSGIMEVWKGAGMQSALRSAADTKRNELTALAASSKSTRGVTTPFVSYVDVLDKTAVGTVTTNVPSVVKLNLI